VGGGSCYGGGGRCCLPFLPHVDWVWTRLCAKITTHDEVRMGCKQSASPAKRLQLSPHAVLACSVQTPAKRETARSFVGVNSNCSLPPLVYFCPLVVIRTTLLLCYRIKQPWRRQEKCTGCYKQPTWYVRGV